MNQGPLRRDPTLTAAKAIDLPTGVVAEELAARICDEITQGENTRAGVLRSIKAGREYLKPRRPRRSKPWKNACEINMAMVKIVRNRLLAQLRSTIFTIHPLFNVEGQRTTDDPMAPWVQQFLEGLFTRTMNLEAVLEPAITAALDDGLAAIHIGWRQEEAPVRRHAYNKAEGWGTQAQAELIYDGPEIEFLPAERFGVYPALDPDIERAKGVYLMTSRYGSEVIRLKKKGFIDTAAYDRLRDSTGEAEHKKTTEATQRGLNYQVTEPDFASKPFDIHICYWRIPAGDDEELQDYYLWLHVPTRTLLHAEPAPRWSGRRPVVLLRPFPDKETIYGDSIYDLVGELEDAMTTLLRQVVDQTSVDISPPVAVEEGAVDDDDLKKFVYAPAQVWRCNRAGGIQVLDHQSKVTIGMGVHQFLRDIVHEASAVSQNAMGVQSDRAQTATESQVLASNQSTLFSMVVDRIRQPLSQVAEHTIWLCYEFVGNSLVSTLWQKLVGTDIPNPFQGVGAQSNQAQQLAPPTGQPPTTPDKPSALDMLGGRYYFNAAGSTESNNKELKRAIMREVYERLLANPLVVKNPLAMFAVTRRYLAEMGIRVPEELIGKEQEVRAALQAQAQSMRDSLGAEEEGLLASQAEAQYTEDMNAVPGAVGDVLGGIFGG